jgi:hypothetical protein
MEKEKLRLKLPELQRMGNNVSYKFQGAIKILAESMIKIIKK